MALATPEELLAIFVPTAVYWIYSGIYVMLESPFEKYKFYSKEEEDEKNLVSRKAVVKGVLLHQTMQAVVNILMFKLTRGNDAADASPRQSTSFIVIARQLLVAMLVIDSWTYFMHRLFHSKLLYRRFHSPHHRLLVVYAFGGQYMHPLEGFFDIMGGSLAVILSGMSPITSMFFFSFALIKLVDDHCGMKIPGNPFHMFFDNNSAYHDVHHQRYGSKYNFSVYFVFWDKLLGTYMPYSLEKKAEGGIQVRRIGQECKDE